MSKRRHPRPAARRRAPARKLFAGNSLYRRSLRYEPLEDRRLLAVVTVDTLADTVDFNDGHTSLREAIFATNTVPGADTINFAPALTANGPATILLKQGELKITDSLTINGPGASLLTIDASGNDPTPSLNNGDGSRIFNVDDGNLESLLIVSIGDLKLTGGDVFGTGGAIRNRENLTVNRSTISGNATSAAAQLPVSYVVGSGGGIFSYRGYLNVNNSSISGNTAAGIGGGVYSKGFGPVRNLSVSYSSIAGNSSGSSGGGIASSYCAIANSTISGNSARQDGGGIFGHDVDLSDSTVSGNSAGRDGGGVSGASGLNLLRSTITKNSAVRSGGGLRADFEATLSHTILAGNMLDGVPHDFTGVMSIEYSLIGILNGTITLGDGNLYGSLGAPVDPLLGPLADNGGFLLPDGNHILTHALLAGSPAINVGDLNAVVGVNGVPQFDERGTPYGRVFGGRIDIGAFEYQQPSDLNLVVDTLVDESDGNYGHGDLSLREAIQLANMYSGPNYPEIVQTIHFDPALTANGPATILLTMGELKITGSMEIDGPGANSLTINATTAGPSLNLFNVDDGTSNFIDVSVKGLTLTASTQATFGSLIRSAENLLVTDSTLAGNHVAGFGIINQLGNLTVTGSTVSGNRATGISSGQGSATISYSTISGNGQSGIYTRGELTVDHTIITGNTSQRPGGGIYSNPLPTSPKSLTITDSTITNNVTTFGEGGGIRKRYGDLAIERSIVSNNKAFAAGGGMSIADGTFSVEIADSQIIGNGFVNQSSLQEGGGIFVTNGAIQVTIERSIVSNNSARTGGGIFVANDARDVTVRQSQIRSNTANDGAGIASGGGFQLLTIDSSTINNNTATQFGIGAAFDAANVLVTNSTISNNTGGLGAFLFSHATFKHSTITGNSSGLGAGRSTLEVGSSIVAGNANGDMTGEVTRITSDGYNVIGTGTALAAFNQPGDQVGITDPKLGPLADNGGFTLPDGSHILTHALLPGSPAINEGDLNAVAGVNGVPQFDERGTPYSRVFGGRIDIGAFEYQQPSDLNLVVDTLVDESDGNFGHGDLSLREAIELANKYPGANYPAVINTIHFDPALTANGPATILLTKGDLKIMHGITIVGPGANLLTVDASGDDSTPDINDGKGSQVFSISGPNLASLMNVSISGLTLTGADASQGGAILSLLTNLTLGATVISGNASTGSGGGVYAIGGNLTIDGCTISNNVAPFGRSSGGGIFYTSSSGRIGGRLDAELQIRNSEISNNTSAFNGGGISAALAGGTVNIENSRISGNSLTNSGSSYGGGLYIASIGIATMVTISGSSIDHNTVGGIGNGGGVYINSASVTINDSKIESNSSARFGGGLYHRTSINSGTLSIAHSSISNNSTGLRGGGIWVMLPGAVTLSNDTIANNVSTLATGDSKGGGVYAFINSSPLTITGTTIRDNSAAVGGGVFAFLSGKAQLLMDDSHVEGNTATAMQGLGGGINLAGSSTLTSSISNSFVESNNAPGQDARGGGIYNAVLLAIANTRIASNTSGRYGGGIYDTFPLQIDGSVIANNSALLTKGIGGGIFRTGNGAFVLNNSVVSGNTATLYGGGLYLFPNAATSNKIQTSTLFGNLAALDGGGIYGISGPLTLQASTVSHNTAGRDGGGLRLQNGAMVDRSTIDNNSAGRNGGGIAAVGIVTITSSTIAQNVATINGGGVWGNPGPSLKFSTVYQNRAGQAGGGVFVNAGISTIINSIIAADTGPSGADISGLLGVTLNVHYSLIGSNQGSGLTPTPIGSPDANGNLIGGFNNMAIDPGLGLLAFNGGPTETLAPLPHSLAINAGDPIAVSGMSGVPANDQRGVPFTRVYGGRIDIGAVEVEPNPLPGDFNYNGVVDMADYVVWRKVHTTFDPRADANGDGRVDDADLAVWRANFGSTYASSAGTATAVASQSFSRAPSKMMADLAIADARPALNLATMGFVAPAVESSTTAKRTWSLLTPPNESGSFNQLLTLVATDRAGEQQSDASAEFSHSPASDGETDVTDGAVAAFDEAFAVLGA